MAHLARVVVALLHAEAREPHRRLAAAAVLLRQVHVELGDHFARVALEGAEQGAVAVHDDEAELGVVGEQGGQRLRVELVVAQVERGVDGLEGLEVDVDLLFGGDKFFFLSMASFIIQSILVLVLCCDLDYYRKR